MNKKTRQIYWTHLDYHIMFKCYDELIRSYKGNYDFFTRVISALHPDKRKPATMRNVNSIMNGYFEWLEDKHCEHWFPHTGSVKYSKPIDLRSEMFARCDAEIVKYESDLYNETMTERLAKENARKEEEIRLYNEESKKKAAAKLNRFRTWPTPKEFIPIKVVSVEQSSDSCTLSESIPVNPFTADEGQSFLKDGFNGKIYKRSETDKFILHFLHNPTLKNGSKLIYSVKQPQVAIRDKDIRSIVREEIEKIFGTTEAKPAANEAVAEEIFKSAVSGSNDLLNLQGSGKLNLADLGEYIAKTVDPTKVVTSPAAVELKQELMSIFLFGIEPQYLSIIAKQFVKVAKIRGGTVFNDSAKKQAKNSDHVFVAKWVQHSAYETFRNECGYEKVTFVSGGISMMKNYITELVNKK